MRALTGAALVTLALARTSFATDLAAVLDSYVERPAADSAITMLLALPSLSGTEAEAGRFLVANDLDEMGLDENFSVIGILENHPTPGSGEHVTIGEAKGASQERRFPGARPLCCRSCPMSCNGRRRG